MTVKQNYILRAYTNSGMKYLESVAQLIRAELGMSSRIIDDRNPDPEQFGLHRFKNNHIISLDKHLTHKFDVDYFPISRVFNEYGEVIGRKIGSTNIMRNRSYHIIDTDICNGETMNIACQMFNAVSFTVPIVVESDQDLIDMEDLLCENSWMQYATSDKLYMSSYLLNEKFFSLRTSLPEYLYKPMCEIFEN